MSEDKSTTSIPSASTWRADIPASLVVFLVALPLSIGIAAASGAPVRAGLVAAIVGGIVVGLFGGAPLQVSGPAAGLTVMVASMVAKFGLETTCAIAVAAGALQMLGGGLGIARMALAISPAVLHAMLAGIGILIGLGQLQVFFGAAPQRSALLNLKVLPDVLQHVDAGALTVGLVTLATLLLWNRFLARKITQVPGSLIAIALGTIVSLFIPAPHVDIGTGSLFAFKMPSLGGHPAVDFIVAALGLAVVASAESLLCAVATDKLHAGARANLNRELLAQGLGNSISGLLGGLPITGVIVRSSANIAAGGKTKMSATMHGVWMLVFVVFFGSFLSYVPKAALAALLINVGYNLVKVKEMKSAKHFGEHYVYAVTILGVVFWNLLAGIGIGFGLAILLLLIRLASKGLAGQFAKGIRFETTKSGDKTDVAIGGNLSFLSVPRLAAGLSAIPSAQDVHVKLDVRHIDHAAIESIEAWKQGYVRAGGKVELESLDALFHKLESTSQRAG